jgi:small subunit ribosomal protein S7
MTAQKQTQNFKIFDLYETNDLVIEDPGLKNVINLQPKLILKSHGRNVQKMGQTKVNVVERLANRLAVSGHRGSKHRIMLGRSTGKYTKNMKIILEAFKLIQEKTGKNPIQVLVKAIENAAPRDEITVIEYGGARYPQAVDISPLRRVTMTLRLIVQGSYDKSHNKKTKIEEALADEIIKAFKSEPDSYVMIKKKDSEKQADSAR